MCRRLKIMVITSIPMKTYAARYKNNSPMMWEYSTLHSIIVAGHFQQYWLVKVLSAFQYFSVLLQEQLWESQYCWPTIMRLLLVLPTQNISNTSTITKILERNWHPVLLALRTTFPSPVMFTENTSITLEISTILDTSICRYLPVFTSCDNTREYCLQYWASLISQYCIHYWYI